MSKSKQNNRKQQTDEILIQSAINGHWLQALSLYHLLKHTFANSIIYYYSQSWKKKELADRFGITTNKLTVLIRQLKKRGLVTKINSGQDLFLRSIYDMKEKFNGRMVRHKCTLWLNSDDTLETIKTKLYEKILAQFARQQIKTAHNKHRNKRSEASLKRSEPASVAGYKKISELFNCSKSQAWYIVKRMKQLNLVATQTVKQRLRRFNGVVEDVPELIGYPLNLNGVLWIVYGTKFNFLQYENNL